MWTVCSQSREAFLLRQNQGRDILWKYILTFLLPTASVTEGKSTGDIVVPQAAQNLIPSFDTLYGSTRQEDPLSRQCSYEWETNDGFGGRLIFSQPVRHTL